MSMKRLDSRLLIGLEALNQRVTPIAFLASVQVATLLTFEAGAELVECMAFVGLIVVLRLVVVLRLIVALRSLSDVDTRTTVEVEVSCVRFIAVVEWSWVG